MDYKIIDFMSVFCKCIYRLIAITMKVTPPQKMEILQADNVYIKMQKVKNLEELMGKTALADTIIYYKVIINIAM